MTTDLPNPNTGIYDVPFNTYRTWKAVNGSTLKQALKSWAHYRHAELFPSDSTTDDLEFGKAFHLVTLEPGRAADLIVCEPEGDGRFKEVKEARAKFRETLSPESIVLSAKDKADLSLMAASLRMNADAAAILNRPGKNEQSMIWTDAKTGLDCKGRVDRIVETKTALLIVDIKTANDASPEKFARDAIRLGYDISAAHYVEGYRAIVAPAKPIEFVWIVIEKDAPYAVSVYRAGEPECEPDMLTHGRVRRARLLKELAACRKAGIYPGYTKAMQPLRVPAWNASQLEMIDE